MKHLAFLLALTVLAASSGFTQEAKFGRTADGRAYRTDSEGNKVIDYIADLEMNVDSLNRQVQGLEDELREKTQVIERMLDGKICDSSIKERDLQKNDSRYADSNFIYSGGAVDCKKEVAAAQAELRAECDHSDTIRRNEIVALQGKLNVLQNEKLSLQKTISAVETNEIRTELASTSAEAKEMQAQLASTNAEATRLEQDIQGATSRIEQLQDELSAKNSEYKLLQAQLASLDKRSSSVRASLAPSSITQPRENFVENRERAIDSLRGNTRTELNRVQGLIGNRDRMYQSYKANQRSAVAFSPSIVRTSDGRDMNMLRSQLENARSMRDVSAVQSGLREIQRKMSDDIGLMQRLARIH